MKKDTKSTPEYYKQIRKPNAPPSKVFISKKFKNKYKKNYEEE